MKKSTRDATPLSGSGVNKKGCGGNLGCALFALPFFLAGVVIIYFMALGPALKIFKASSWNPTPCIITSSTVGRGGDDTYAVEIAYTYSVNGVEYQSDRYDFFSGYTSGHESKAEVVRQNPVGKKATCYVNPANPAEAVFDREFSSDAWFGLAGIPFFLVGAVGLYMAAVGTLKNRRRSRRLKAKRAAASPGFDTIRYKNPSPEAQIETDYQENSFQPGSFQPGSFQTGSYPQGPSAPATFQPAPSYEQPVAEQPVENAFASFVAHTAPAMPAPQFGRVTLEPQTSPGCRLGMLTGFTLFWNGIVSVFVWQLIKGFSEGNGEYFLGLFLTPFVLIGLGLILATAHSFLTLFNPRPKITLSSGQLHIGEEFDLEWEFSGSTRSIKRLRVYLEGREEATYRRGTTTSTDKSVFAKIDIADMPSAARGRARVSIPTYTMHSFASSNNKIIWDIHVVGEIRLWSDVDETFLIQVLPKRFP